MFPKQVDPVIDEVRQERHRISQQCGHDPARLVAYYMELQKKYAERLIAKKEQAEQKDQTVA
jgi:hypothetical protein